MNERAQPSHKGKTISLRTEKADPAPLWPDDLAEWMEEWSCSAEGRAIMVYAFPMAKEAVSATIEEVRQIFLMHGADDVEIRTEMLGGVRLMSVVTQGPLRYGNGSVGGDIDKMRGFIQEMGKQERATGSLVNYGMIDEEGHRHWVMPDQEWKERLARLGGTIQRATRLEAQQSAKRESGVGNDRDSGRSDQPSPSPNPAPAPGR